MLAHIVSGEVIVLLVMRGSPLTFMIASISKTFVSIVLAKTATDLDAPIDAAFGGPMRDPDAPDTVITPRMLATHTSGLIDDWITLGAESTEGDHPGTLESFARDYWTAAHFGNAPGTRRTYSNAGFGVLGAFVELAAHETLPALTARHILEPLHMTESGWHLSDFDESTLAVPYNGALNDGLIRYKHEGYRFYSATSMRTSIRDLAVFLATVTRRGVAPDGTRIYDEAIATKFETVQLPALDEDQALVWYYETINGKKYLGHTGSALGFSALMFFDPATKNGAILITNSDLFIRGRLGDREISKVLYTMTGEILEY